MEKKKKTSVAVVTIILLLILQALISVPIINYYSKGVGYEFDAEVKQCESALENYNDKLPDLVNYERTNTDNLAINNQNQFKECRKIIEHPEHYVKIRYISFWITTIVTEVLIIVFIALVIILLILMATKEDKPIEDYTHGYY